MTPLNKHHCSAYSFKRTDYKKQKMHFKCIKNFEQNNALNTMLMYHKSHGFFLSRHMESKNVLLYHYLYGTIC